MQKAQARAILARLRAINAKPHIIQDIQGWTKNAQTNLQTARVMSQEIKKIVGLSKEPENLSKYLISVLESGLEVFSNQTRKYLKIGLITFVLYKSFSILGFLAQFTNVQLIRYLARYLRLIYFANYLAYFLKFSFKDPQMFNIIRSIIVLIVVCIFQFFLVLLIFPLLCQILFIEDIVEFLAKLWQRIEGSSISIPAKNAYKITIMILAYIYLKEVKNQVVNLSEFNGELVEMFINLTKNEKQSQ